MKYPLPFGYIIGNWPFFLQVSTISILAIHVATGDGTDTLVQ